MAKADAAAKALQCPDCGYRHPLGAVAHLGTFRCQECNRLLKVPKGVGGGSEPDAGPQRDAREAPTKATTATKTTTAAKVPPSERGDAIEAQRRAATAPGDAVVPVPRIVRAGVWAVSLPLGLLPVAFVARRIGLLTVDRAIDIFVGVGFGRFVPPLLTLPVWAALSATIAHFAIEAIRRRLA